MKILVLGSGGREHALAWKLAQEADVIASPGNPGIEDDGIPCFSAATLDEWVRLATDHAVDLVVVGPEDPLVAGLADALRTAGIAVFGPGADGAKLEASKAFSKEVMREAGVPTAPSETHTDLAAACDYAALVFDRGRGVAVKASGNALGKGVVVCDVAEEAHEALERMLVHREFGDAGATVVIEEKLRGPEFSLLTLVSDRNVVSLPVAQDHKRAFDGDRGPNTGGMGTYSPVPLVSEALLDETEARVVRPVVAELARRGIPYRGTLFSGLMLDEGRVYCLEYNVRFGDPETQTVMMRLGDGLADALFAAAQGEEIPPPRIATRAAVTVVVASEGYPGTYEKGRPLSLPASSANAKVFHAGTRRTESGLVNAGGRVVGCSASGATYQEARDRAYALAEAVRLEGSFYRRDIGPVA